MSPWLGAAAFAAGVVGMAVIRAPHIRRSVALAVDRSDRTKLDTALVALVSLGLILPLLWIATPLLDFADQALGPVRLVAGVSNLVLGLWLLHRSHVDLGANWSNTLELRHGHTLITAGIYRRIRHPMYLALLVFGVGQALVLSSWIAGPAFALPLAVLVAFRLGREERMMKQRFPAAWTSYASRTARLVPSLW